MVSARLPSLQFEAAMQSYSCENALCCQAGYTIHITCILAGTPSAASASATVAVMKREDIKNAKKAAKAAQKAMEFNNAFGGQGTTIV